MVKSPQLSGLYLFFGLLLFVPQGHSVANFLAKNNPVFSITKAGIPRGIPKGIPKTGIPKKKRDTQNTPQTMLLRLSKMMISWVFPKNRSCRLSVDLFVMLKKIKARNHAGFYLFDPSVKIR
ncbi:hypothetical protein ACM7MN_07525 [Pseudomonas paraeruginosa]|uniref:hypothetical protein n=1 Tax=Pseudomonas paraeruginosa TaxID=2994495 RepID=UPI0039FD5732